MARIFVGNLPADVRESELDDLFYKYGRIRDIDIKHPSRPPAFAFVSFSYERDAEDAVRGRDGYNYDGYRLRVELAKGSRRDEGRDNGRDRGRTQRRSDYGIIVSGLPRGASWQDLKDNMRKYGDVIYTDVGRDGEGVVEFSNRDDMEHALRSADDSEFRSNRADNATIRVKPRNTDTRERSPSRDDRRSRSRDRDGDRDRRSPSRSPRRSSPRRSPSRSRSPSKERSRSRDRAEGNGREEDR